MAEARDEVAVFRSVAERYVALVEAAGEQSRDALFTELVRMLSMLYETAARLPDLEPDTVEGAIENLVPQARVKEVIDRLGAVIDQGSDLYLTVVPYGEDEGEQAGGLLTNDLGEIYLDVKNGFEQEAAGASENDVVWEWRFGFWTHWGGHVVNALRIMHLHLSDVSGPPGGF